MPLTHTKDLFAKALKGKYALGAFNVNNMELIQAIIEACEEEKAPLILQISKGARQYANPVYLKKLIEAAVSLSNIPIAVHLDHGDTFELCKQCIDEGFTSVMIDASHEPFEKNAEITRKVVEYAHKNNCSVESELGHLVGAQFDEGEEGGAHSTSGHYTNPEESVKFVKETGCDSLAIAIGNSHGAYKFNLGAVQIVVNNAGIAQIYPPERVTEQIFEHFLRVNLTSVFLVTQRVLPAMRAARWGRIINLSSIAAQTGGIIGLHYAASKAGILGLTHSYAAQLGKEGITANAIAPGLIDTDMAASVPESVRATIPIESVGSPDDVARIAVLLAENKTINGQTFNINAGRYMS